MGPLASEGALPVLVQAMGVQQKCPYPRSVCACTVTVYFVAGFPDQQTSWCQTSNCILELPDDGKASW